MTGGNLSTIAGSLKATGSLYLINPQGMIVSGTGRVLTGGNFVGSSRDLSDDDFAHGKRRFTGTSKGAVVNQGTIRSSNGDVALIGSSASNSGILSASHGSASLAAGNTVLLAPAGSGGRILVSGGSGDVTNSGTIAAAQAQLNAAGGNVYALSGNNGGIVRATGTSTIGGHVWLTSNSGNVSISGTVAATNANGSGGVVTARAGNIVISGNINMSATKATMIGGTVSIVAKDTTDVSGRIAAQGGDHGTGGFVETSGQHVHVEGSARITTLAKDGIAGDWLIDPNDFTIAASGGDITGATLSSALAGGSVTIKSSQGATAGNGDIFVDANVSWSTTKTLTLDAYRNIDINDAINISGGGGLSLIYGDQAQTGTGNAADGDLVFSGGNVAFTSVSNGNNTKLQIDGQAYTLENTVAALSSAISSTPAGFYALANSYNDNSTSSTIATTFTGTLEGLGNTISDGPTLFKQIGDGISSGSVRDLSLTNLAGYGSTEYLSAPDVEAVGGFAAVLASGSTIDDVSISGSLSLGGCQCQPTAEASGGLVGYNQGTIKNSSADTILIGGSGTNAGGLVGFNTSSGLITHSSAAGSLNIISFGGNLGGLVEENAGVISYSNANESIGSTDYEFMAGGLVAQNDSSGGISNSYATGTIASVEGGPAGGLVALNKSGGTIASSYALGTVQSSDASAGGLVGENSGSISNAYAMGNVLGGNDNPTRANVGGLVGDNEGTIANAYSTGVASGYGYIGGLVGRNGGHHFSWLLGYADQHKHQRDWF